MCSLWQEEELSRQQRREAAEAARAAERHAAQQKRDEESTEKLQLLVALRTARKMRADELGQVREAGRLGTTGQACCTPFAQQQLVTALPYAGADGGWGGLGKCEPQKRVH
jgi:hypothetical protein